MDYADYKTLIETCGVHPALGPVGDGWAIEQNPHELATFLASMPSDIQSVLEIGTGYRAGLARFMTECLGWQVTTLDRWMPDTPAPMARQIVGMSQDEDVREMLRGTYDLVIIDADHHYEAAKADFEAYGSMGRIVMFHDIAGLRECEGAAQLWKELSEARVEGFTAIRYEAIAEDDRRAGIGWIKRIEQTHE